MAKQSLQWLLNPEKKFRINLSSSCYETEKSKYCLQNHKQEKNLFLLSIFKKDIYL